MMVDVKCKNCGKDIKRSPSQISNCRFVFCSNTCKTKYYYNNMENANYTMNHTWMFAIKILRRNKNDKREEEYIQKR